MTERERWTVYPLLFLSLGIAMRSHITSSLELHEITCQTLKSRDVQITDGGAVRLFSADGKPEVVLQAAPGGGLVELATAGGIVQVVLAVGPSGGVVDTFDAHGKQFRRLAVGIDPRARILVAPPPAPPAEEPTSETPATEADKPPTTEEPAGEKPAGTNDEPSEKPADR